MTKTTGASWGSRVGGRAATRVRAIAVAALCAAAVGGGAPAAQAASGDTNLSTPILFVHGYDAFGTGVNCTMWNNMISAMKSYGFTGPFVTMKYYDNDTNCSGDVNTAGSQTTYYPGGTVNGDDSQSTDVRHIAYQFAWFVYNNYTSKGQNVGIVPHSMGGLIVRDALYRVAAGDPDFPPSLLVSNIADFATPHNGTSSANTCSNIQCVEMRQNSTFLNDLNANGQNPQAQGGTDWTLMGSDYDTIVSDASATSMTAAHKVQYASSDRIGHLDYYNKTQTTLDASLQFSDNGSPFTSTSSGEWPVLRAEKALTGGGY